MSDAFIALPGGFGTYEEFFEAVTWTQLGVHKKPCGLLNVHGYFDGLLSFIERRREPTSTVTTGSASRFRYHAGWVLIPPCDATTTIWSSSWGMYRSGTVRGRPLCRPVVVSRQIGAPPGTWAATRPLLSRYAAVLMPVIHRTATRPRRSWNAVMGRVRGSTIEPHRTAGGQSAR